jgi:Domain of unknown function (DUF4419)
MSNKMQTSSNGAGVSCESVTFAVEDVTPASSPLETCKPLEAVQALLNGGIERSATDESGQRNPMRGRVESCWSYSLDCVADIGHHPLLAAAHLAFSGHRPLVLSPDMIWVTIVQGFAQHIQLNPEAHRAFLVRHEGKRELIVDRDDMYRRSPENPWAEVVGEFASLLRRELGELAERLVSDFSTTGPLERTVSEIALLDVFQSYFTYTVGCICGIPSVTLEGTPSDWRKLREKVELLAPFGLDWWLRELRPICDQFARAAGGDIDLGHWRRLYKIRAVYGADVINGWLGKLIPYAKDFETGKFSKRNDLLDPAVDAEILRLEEEELKNGGERRVRFDAPGIRANMLPRGLSMVPITWKDSSGKRAMELLAGPIAVVQDRKTGALRPTLGWAVRDSSPIEQALFQLAEHMTEPAKAEPVRKTQSTPSYVIPTEAVRFYRDVEEAVIQGKNGAPLYRILPLALWAEREWIQEAKIDSGRMRMDEMFGMFRFAELSDGTELLIRLYRWQEKETHGVFVGQEQNGSPLAATGQKVAQSFTDFLLRALDGGSEPYFRRKGFVALA